MRVETLGLSGAMLAEPRRFADERGWFFESYNERIFREHGVAAAFVQENHSLSRPVGTLRGLHCQAPPHAQAKLVRCIRGRVWDVVVDMRRGSPTYARWEAAELSPEIGRQIFVPTGFLHGFVTLEPDTEVIYKVSDYYAPACEGGVRWDDPALAIPWPLDGRPVLSPKDENLPWLSDFVSPFVYENRDGSG